MLAALWEGGDGRGFSAGKTRRQVEGAGRVAVEGVDQRIREKVSACSDGVIWLQQSLLPPTSPTNLSSQSEIIAGDRRLPTQQVDLLATLRWPASAEAVVRAAAAKASRYELANQLRQN